jgi:IS30 family transposase
MRTKLNRLTLSERVVIQTLLGENKNYTYIAKQLDRNVSSISREVKKWVKKPTDKYNAELAQFCAKEEYLNKRNLDKINTYFSLKVFVYKGLLNDFSPEQIAGSIKDIYPNDPIMSISHEAIYQHIYRHRQSRIARKLIALLPYNHSRRRKHRKYGTKRVRIPDALSIEHRPAHVQNRLEVGHWEGDQIVGLGHKSAIATMVERKTRYTYIIFLKDRTSETMTKAIADTLNNLFTALRKTMTYDNGMEMANHKWLTENTGMDIYFANPYSPWERGTNENTNGLIRRYFPKKTDFNNVTEEQLKIVQDKLNKRPRKVLGYKTPEYMLELEISKIKNLKFKLI